MEKYRLGRILLTFTTDYLSLCHAVSPWKINRESSFMWIKISTASLNLSNSVEGIRGEMTGVYLNYV